MAEPKNWTEACLVHLLIACYPVRHLQMVLSLSELTLFSNDRLEVTIWVVPSLIENAVAVAFIGLVRLIFAL